MAGPPNPDPPMILRRYRGLVAIGLVVTALLAIAWIRWSDLTDATAAARTAEAAARSEIAALSSRVADLQAVALSTETRNARTKLEASREAAIAEAFLAQIQKVERDRNAAALAAWVSGGRVNDLRLCLAGVNKALNQQSVGDPGAIRTLQSVRTTCRAAGA